MSTSIIYSILHKYYDLKYFSKGPSTLSPIVGKDVVNPRMYENAKELFKSDAIIFEKYRCIAYFAYETDTGYEYTNKIHYYKDLFEFDRPKNDVLFLITREEIQNQLDFNNSQNDLPKIIIGDKSWEKFKEYFSFDYEEVIKTNIEDFEFSFE